MDFPFSLSSSVPGGQDLAWSVIFFVISFVLIVAKCLIVFCQ